MKLESRPLIKKPFKEAIEDLPPESITLNKIKRLSDENMSNLERLYDSIPSISSNVSLIVALKKIMYNI